MREVPLIEAPRHFAGIRQSPYMVQYLSTVLKLCPRGGRTLETGTGSGYGAIFLSHRGIRAEGIDTSPEVVERARQVNNILQGRARFRVGDLFTLYIDVNGKPRPNLVRYNVIHHQGVLEHFTVPEIRAILAQQVVIARWVVISVPSVFYPFGPENGDERLLPVEEWARILSPFDVAELKYYGDTQHGEREHILAILKGAPADGCLSAMMRVPDEPFTPGISAIVHTRNEERHIGECLESLKSWTDEQIVCDMESDDQTVEVAKHYTDRIVRHPLIPNFDRARNVSAMRAQYAWVFYLDADERVPEELGVALRQLVVAGAVPDGEGGPEFEGLLLPFRHYFAGRWMHCLYPGYTAPRLLKNGRFFFNTRLHSGAYVDGRIAKFPADDSELALVHYSYDSLSHYLNKLDRYTDGEALNMHRDGARYHWSHAIRHFVQDFRAYYDDGRAWQDRTHGLIWSFNSAFYRFSQHAKLFERRFRAQQLEAAELDVPPSAEDLFAYALAVAREPRPVAVPDIRLARQDEYDPARRGGGAGTAIGGSARMAEVVWTGPLLDPSGYGEEARNLLLSLDSAGVSVAAHPIPWSRDKARIPDDERARLEELSRRDAVAGFTHVIHNFAPAFARHPEAAICIGRTQFETDRLPQDWVRACNRMDYVWVPSEFNRRTFAAAGVVPEKLAVVPPGLDGSRYQAPVDLGSVNPVVQEIAESARDRRFTFLSVFDWTLHKGWDVLLRAFVEEFAQDWPVRLVLKVWSTMGYSPDDIRAQATEYLKREIGHDLSADPRIRFVFERLSSEEMIALYQAADCYVMPSRGEGWGRPYMEAMACGKPVIATDWSGSTAFLSTTSSYLVDCDVVPVPETAWREIPTYRGHRWAEPDRKHLKERMRRVYTERDEAAIVGEVGREYVLTELSPEKTGARIRAELERVRELRAERFSTGQIAPSSEPETETPATVRWEGAQLMVHSLAHVNREICLGLVASGKVELSLVQSEPAQLTPEDDPRLVKLLDRCFAPLSRPADVHIRHAFPPRFTRPDEGHLVLIQPWEYGYLPESWLSQIEESVAEVWCYSNYVRDVYRRSGVPEEKLQVVPLGVDTKVFHIGAPPYCFTTEPGAKRLNAYAKQPFVFLYVGGTIHRKGIDVLLDAYKKAFTSLDDVCLVVKDMGTNTVYFGQNEAERIQQMAEDPAGPLVVYLDRDLTPHELAGIYTAADCLVAPYRGEGFCLPALEAMSCGVPAIVPECGPTDDFVDETVGWRAPAARKEIPGNRIGEMDLAGPGWTLEVSPDDLARTMRQVFADPEEAMRRGGAARERARDHWSWQHTTERVLERLEALRNLPAPTSAKSDSSEDLIVHAPPHAKTERATNGHAARRHRSGNVWRDKGSPASGAVRPAPRVSLCMIVRNEERVLGDCLTSALPHFDELIIVDTGSTDRTVEIAEKAGAKVIHFPWTDSFSDARNVSIQHATGDWIFWMDADDTLPEACGRGIREIVELAEDHVLGYLVQVHMPAAPGADGLTVVDHVKLFRNRPDLRFEGRIHEQILESINRAGGDVMRTSLYVVHSGYDHSPEGQKRKRERDAKLLQLDLDERPEHPFPWFNLGMTAFHTGDFAGAIPALERCLALSKPRESIVRKVYAMLAGSCLALKDIARAREWIEKGLAIFPRDPELLFRAGAIYKDAGDPSKAESAYLRLLGESQRGHLDSLDVTMTGYKAQHNLGVLYLETRRFKEAEQRFRLAVEQEPKFVAGWVAIAECLFAQGRGSEAESVALKLQDMAPEEATSLRRRMKTSLAAMHA